MEQKILDLLKRPNYTPLNPAELRARLGLRRSQQRELEHVLARLERNGQIARIKQGNRYALPLAADLVPGRIRMNRQGVGFVEADDPKIPTIRVPFDATSTAMHGDRVLVRRDALPRFPRRSGAEEVTGRVVRVLEPARTRLVGTLQRGKRFLHVIPDDPRITHDIYVTPPRNTGRPAQAGDKVVVELREWKSRHANPEGEIIEVLGPPDAEGVDMLSVIRHYNLPLHFPKRVLQEARSIGQEVRPAERTGRVDCRAHQVVTIDPEDAKDFDDAICLQQSEPGYWKLWVHIADVSHYVKPGSALDEEAARRGNSTYLVDRVVPMLPEALSNELCSLKPQVERLTKCVEFLLSADGQVRRTQFYPAVIRSQRRYNYPEVLALLQRRPQDPLERMLHDANGLAQTIRRARFKAGSLDLDFPETKIRLDARGRVLRLEKVENDISHQLIEEFMLLANEAVADRLMALRRPAIYRIHEPPDDKRLHEYREEVLSHHVQCGNLSNRREVQKLLEKLNRLPVGQALKIGFLKSLMRARYAVEPLGHYGLAKKKYAHFTSPIRRYADLVVHRALFQPPGQPLAVGSLKEVADHISETERNSDDAERDSRDVKMFAFLSAQLKSGHPPRHEALVTDVRNFGFFVDVPGLGMSGLVPLSGLSDDFYQFEAARGQLLGRRTRRVFKLGDKVAVQVAKVDTFKRQVDFKLAMPAGARAAGQPSSAGSATSHRSGGRRQRAF
ncbi:MAG TPA: ribonuclease R [Candidatus Paceibacterota bacterium]|nr:ribonuclease R [Verrucomicrobiota bacterium]HSA12004.1 ribonuclease R [Candidatus Paceibacterota bacterium]